MYFTNEALLNEQSDQTYNELANRIFSNSFVLFEALLAEHGWYISEIGFAQYCPGHTKTLSYDPKEATCTKTGTKTTLCAYCGLVMKEETIPTTAHQWNSGTVTKKATCSEAGVLTYTCQKCGTTKTETIPATAHQWNSGAVTKQASCNENGEMTYTCELCGTTRTESIPMTAHQWDAGVVTKSATCVETGEMTYTCMECSATKTEAIAKTTHNYVSSVVPATMTASGQIVSACSVCGKVKKTKAINQINSVKLSQTSFVYDGTAKTPAVTVKDIKGKVVNPKYYTVKYAKGCTEIGAYKVKVVFKDLYSGTAACVFKIVPGRVTDLTANSKKTGIVKVAWSPVDGAQKYVIYCSTTKKGSYQKVAVTAKTAYNVKDLASGKTYYFTVKALTQTGGKNYFSAVSNIAKARVK
ncbi:MAG: fibronectin type III domain-containing protein [Clostridia bacterium]|nr:fibronectin type III domain-containing protein [Clostridia bacterium]